MQNTGGIEFRKLRGNDPEGETVKELMSPDEINPNQSLGFDNDGNVIVKTRAYRRRKIKIEIDRRYLPKKKKRAKKSKKNYLIKRKK